MVLCNCVLGPRPRRRLALCPKRAMGRGHMSELEYRHRTVSEGGDGERGGTGRKKGKELYRCPLKWTCSTDAEHMGWGRAQGHTSVHIRGGGWLMGRWLLFPQVV